MKVFLSQLSTTCKRYFTLWDAAALITLYQLGYNSDSFVPVVSLLLLFGYKVWGAWWSWKLSNFPKPLQSLFELEEKLNRLELTLEEVRQKTNNVSLTLGFKHPPLRIPNE